MFDRERYSFKGQLKDGSSGPAKTPDGGWVPYSVVESKIKSLVSALAGVLEKDSAKDLGVNGTSAADLDARDHVTKMQYPEAAEQLRREECESATVSEIKRISKLAPFLAKEQATIIMILEDFVSHRRDERNELREENEQIRRKLNLFANLNRTCLFCAQSFDDASALKKHSETCPKHPAAALREENKSLQDKIAELNAKIVELSLRAEEVQAVTPICSDHATSWYTGRTIITSKSGCLLCDLDNMRAENERLKAADFTSEQLEKVHIAIKTVPDFIYKDQDAHAVADKIVNFLLKKEEKHG